MDATVSLPEANLVPLQPPLALQLVATGDVYLEHHLNDRDGRPLAAPSKKQHLAGLRHFFDNQQMYHGVGINPASSVRGPKYSAREGKTPAFHDKQVRDLIDSVGTGDVDQVRTGAKLPVEEVLLAEKVMVPAVCAWAIDPNNSIGSANRA